MISSFPIPLLIQQNGFAYECERALRSQSTTTPSSILSLPTVPIQMEQMNIAAPSQPRHQRRLSLLFRIEPLFSHGTIPDHNALHMGIRRPQSDSSFSHSRHPPFLQRRDQCARDGNERPPYQFTVLFKAVSAEDVEMLRFLIEQGADPKVRNRRGEKKGLSSSEAVERSKNEKIKHAVLGETKSKVNKRTEKAAMVYF